MPEDWIRLRQGISELAILKIKIEPSTITARIEPIGTLLEMPLNWEWALDTWKKDQLFWDMISLSADLLWTDKGRLISVSFPASVVDDSPPRNLLFPLNITQVEEVEELRAAGDAMFLLRITTHLHMEARTNLVRPNVSSISQVSTRPYQSQIAMAITIPKSTWEKNVLPNFGLNGLSSLTISFPQGTQKIFAAPLYELQRAEKTLRTASTEEQFESVVLQCRNAIDSLLNQFTFQLPNRTDGNPDASFSTRADALASQELKTVLSESQAKAVSHILKDLWEPYSGATKPGPAHHSKAFATFALHRLSSLLVVFCDSG